MKRIRNSLMGRLLVGMTIGLLLVFGASYWIANTIIKHEVEETLNNFLVETADRLLPLARHQVEELTEYPDGHIESSHSNELVEIDDFNDDGTMYRYILRDNLGNVLLASHEAQEIKLPALVKDGLYKTDDHYIYKVSSDDTLFEIIVLDTVGHHDKVKSEMLEAFAPISFVVGPSVLAIMAAITFFSLHPLKQFARQIQNRNRADLTSLEIDDLPLEMRPVGRSVNHLLGRMKRAMAAEQSFAAHSAHELKTPLATALAQTQILLRKADSQSRPRLEKIEASLQGLSQTSNKLLELSKAEGASLRSTEAQDLKPVCAYVISEFQRTLPADRIQVHYHADQIMSFCDPDAYGILLRNLIENADKYGTMNKPIIVQFFGDGALSAENDCVPIDYEIWQQWLQAFKRGNRETEGSGLGLSICKSIADGSDHILDYISPIYDDRGIRITLTPIV